MAFINLDYFSKSISKPSQTASTIPLFLLKWKSEPTCDVLGFNVFANN